MDDAVESLLSRERPLAQHCLSSLTEYFTSAENSNDWVLREFLHHLLHLSPLQVHTADHSVFYSLLVETHNTLMQMRQQQQQQPQQNRTQQLELPQFCFNVSGGSRQLYASYSTALLCILKALTDRRLHSRMQSVSELPRLVMLPLLRRNGLRRYLMNRIFLSVEDQLDPMQLYREAAIGLNTMERLTAMNEANRKAGNYETPVNEPNYYNGAGQGETAPLEYCTAPNPEQGVAGDVPAPLILLPLRRPILEYRPSFASKQQLHLLCAVFSILGSTLEEALAPLEAELRDAVGRFSFIFSLLDLTICESLDNQSSGSPAMRDIYGSPEFQPLLVKLDALASDCRSLIRGECQSIVLRLSFEKHTAFINQFYEELRDNYMELFPGQVFTDPKAARPRQWMPVRTETFTVPVLLARLSSESNLLRPLLRLKSFLKDRPQRNRYAAYELPAGSMLVNLELSIVCIRQRYASRFPKLFESFQWCSLVGGQTLYLVALPELLECVKLLILLESFPTRSSLQLRDYHSNIFMKAFCGARVESPLYSVALYCMASALAFMLGGRRAQSQVAEPADSHFTLYRFLPKMLQLCSTSANLSESLGTPAEQCALLGFLCLGRRNQLLKASVLDMILDRGIDALPEDPVLSRELNALRNKRAGANVASTKDYTLPGRCKLPLFIGLYDAILNGRVLLDLNETRTVLFALGFSKLPSKIRLAPARPETALTEPEVEALFGIMFQREALPLLGVEDFIVKNETIMRGLLKNSLFHTASPTAKWLAQESQRCFASLEAALPRTLRETSPEHEQLCLAMMGAEHRIFGGGVMKTRLRQTLCPAADLEKLSVLYMNNSQTGPLQQQLPVDERFDVQFEECFFLCDNPDRWSTGTLPGSDLLTDTPAQSTVIDCAQLTELALQYNEDWPACSALTRGSPFENHYSKLVRQVHLRTAKANNEAAVT